MNKSLTGQSTLQARTKRTTLILGYWTAAWLATTATASFAPKFIWNFNQTLSTIAVLVNLLVGIGMLQAHKRHLRGLDELQQKIILEAMSLSLGVGLIAGLSYELMSQIKLLSFHAQISHLVMLMAITYIVGVLLGRRRYQ